jgi:hypothetical protein
MRLDRIDEKRMLGFIEIESDECELQELEVPIKFEVCGRCCGQGSHVNPNVDGHGITSSEWEQEWSEDEKESYLSGRYDVTCYECNGRRVCPVVDEDRCPPEIVLKIQEQQEEDYRYDSMARMERMMGA